MPQASSELQEAMRELFGDPVGDEGPIRYLEDAGYELQQNWTWRRKPGVSSYGDMTQDEYNCLAFLVGEWDFGGLEDVE